MILLQKDERPLWFYIVTESEEQGQFCDEEQEQLLYEERHEAC